VIDEIAEIPVSVKSVPAVVDNVVQSRSSVPVTVKVMVESVDVAADRARVTVVGAVVSMTSALFAASEFAAPGDAKVSVALLPAASAMVPPLSASEFVAT